MKKAIFLGVQKIHSNKKNQDYRKLDLYTLPFKGANGYTYGGVQSVFTPLDSTLGNGIAVGSIVVPTFVYDHYTQREDLTALEVAKPSPYQLSDFD